MDEDMEHDDYEMAMPFISVASAGGPHDDESFVCGYECGWLAGLMETALNLGVITFSRPVHAINVPQIDLIAMAHGMHVASVSINEEDEDWAWVTISNLVNGDEHGEAFGDDA